VNLLVVNRAKNSYKLFLQHSWHFGIQVWIRSKLFLYLVPAYRIYHALHEYKRNEIWNEIS